jgi:hypothetical protein
MLAGLLPGVITFFALSTPWFDLININPTLTKWLPPLSALAFPIVPLSFAYAIARHQVIPVSLMIRRSVQYLLAKNALRALLVLPLVGIALTIILNPNRTASDILFRSSVYFYLLVAASVVLGLVFRKRLGDWIDRKFFREAYNQEKILRELIGEVKRSESIAEMSALVSHKVESALHPERLYLFYREQERQDLSLGYSSGGTTPELRIPEEFRLLRFMELQGGAQDFPFPQKNNLPQGEKDWLAGLGTSLIVPMTGTDERLAGLFLLGPKKSEVPYTSGDRELLETLADQIAIVYENARLKERVDRDRKIKHEVLSRLEGGNVNLIKECPACGACFDGAEQVCPKDRSELTLTLPVERTIDGKYRLDQLIGRGGMGAVYRATDLRLGREVAVKILTGSMFGNSEALRRFEREARASARLSHANIITVHDYGLLSTEGAFLVMELARGETLRDMLKREGRLEPQTAAELFIQVLEAVKAAHAVGVIHRDLKPENLLVSKEENGTARVRVLDFGLAKFLQPDLSDETTAPVTMPGKVMGTFGYMSPEQLTGGEADERSDLFAIGVMAVEALTGERPFKGKTYHELLNNILNQTFHLRGDTAESRRLDEIFQRCLAKDRGERYTSAAEMQQELIPAMRACPATTFALPVGLEADTAILNRRRD